MNLMSSIAVTLLGSAIATVRVRPSRLSGSTVCLMATSGGMSRRILGSTSKRGSDAPRKHHVRPQGFEQVRAHPGHAVQARQGAKRAVLLTPGDDALCQGGPDARQPRDLRHVGAIDIDPLPREEWARQARG